MHRNTFKNHTLFLHDYAFLTPNHHVPARARRLFNYLVHLAQALPRSERFYVWRQRPNTWENLFSAAKGRRRGWWCDELSKIELTFINLVSRISYFNLPWTICVTLNCIDRAEHLEGGESIDLGLMAEICHLYHIPFKVLP